MRVIKPSMHFLENFMPMFTNEAFAIEELKKASEIPFYKALELGIVKDAGLRKEVHKIVDQRNYQLTIWCSPVIADAGLYLSSLDSGNRKAAVAMAKDLVDKSVEMGAIRCGLQSGPDLGDALRDDAKKALMESCLDISEYAAKNYKDVRLVIEPLDRYVHKKQLLGPIGETVDWFKELNKHCDNFFIHWDSAHEKLGGADLVESLKLAGPFMDQFHICNCTTDPQHPYYGDWHMEVGEAPDFKTDGYLTPEVGAEILKAAKELPDCKGNVDTTYVALEVRCLIGNDPWRKEKLIRTFMQKVFDLADIPYEK